MNRTVSYLLKEEEILEGIDRLNVDSDEYIIIDFGGNLRLDNYKNIDVIKIYEMDYRMVGRSIFILKKSDLPSIRFNELTTDQIEKISLEKKDFTYNIYASIIDCNGKIRTELNNINEDLRKSLLLNIRFNAEIRWKKQMTSVWFQVYDKYQEKGYVNSTSDVKAIN